MRSPHGIGAMAVAAAALVAAAAGLLAAGGCSCKESQPPPPRVVQVQQPAVQPAPAAPAAPQGQAPAPGRQVGESVLRGPGDYLYTATVTAPRFAKKTVATAYIENEIKQFQASQGRYPDSLEELGKWLGEPVQAAPGGTRYNYDPKTGTVEVVPVD